MSLMDSVYPKTETNYVCTIDLNYEHVGRFDREFFEIENAEDKAADSGIPKIKYLFSMNITVQHVPD